ncbi:MAG: metallophosphoesterase family protein [Candidatus Scalinduaceae bacterium]
MMLGFISDAHGNYIGLKKCIDFLKKNGAEKIIFLGDAVGYFPNPNEVLNLLIAENIICLLGNHDAMLIGQLDLDDQLDKIYKIYETKKIIDNNCFSVISSWLPFSRIEINSKRILCLHGSPWNPVNGYIYPNSDLANFSYLDCDFVFMGHTHLPFIKKVGNITVVNVGSCGLPRDQGNLLSCVLHNIGQGKVEIFRVLLDTDFIIKKYEAIVHENVLNCMKRRTKENLIIGKVISG